MDYRARSFQIRYWYIYYAKYIVRFCGLLGHVVEKSATETSNKHKFQGANCGNQERCKKAVSSINVTVRLPGDGKTTLLSCSNFFIYIFVLGFESM